MVEPHWPLRARQGATDTLFPMGDLRYADAGVDIDEGNRAVGLIRRTIASTHNPQVLGGIGAFSGLFALDPGSAPGHGARLERRRRRHQGQGRDRDRAARHGRRRPRQPLRQRHPRAGRRAALLPRLLRDRPRCRPSSSPSDRRRASPRPAARTAARCIGGETAEMPGVYAAGEYDLAGFIVGVVRGATRSSTAAASRAGDVLLGAAVQRACTPTATRSRAASSSSDELGSGPMRFPGTDRPVGDALLAPHRSYLAAIRALRRADRRQGAGAHHRRRHHRATCRACCRRGCAREHRRASWTVPPIFDALQRAGGVTDEEMFRAFNMGVGMVVIVPAGRSADRFRLAGIPVWRIGEVVTQSGTRRVVLAVTVATPIAVLVSGAAPTSRRSSGSASDPAFPARVALVISNRRSARALDVARGWEVPALALPQADFGGNSAARDREMLARCRGAGVRLVVCAGYDRILSDEFLDAYPGRHPQRASVAAPRLWWRHGRRRAGARPRCPGDRVHRPAP